MKIALIHNRYQHLGGEDVMVAFERRLLEDAGHHVVMHEADSGDLQAGSKLAQLQGRALTAARAAWNRQAQRRLLDWLKEQQPDVGHVHNWFPLLSPSVYGGLRGAGVPVVQTLHNYRLFCAGGMAWRDGEVCTDCIDGQRSRAVRRACYRGSSLQTAVWARTMAKYRTQAMDLVDAYLAPSATVAYWHQQAGLPRRKMHVVPNATDDPGAVPWPEGEPTALFVGRLEPEKGIDRLLDGWRTLPWRLEVIGAGSMEVELRERFADQPAVVFHGQQSRDQVRAAVAQASVMVFPSVGLEPFGLGVIEAMASGRAVVTAGPGAPGELIQPGRGGLHVPDPTPIALAQASAELLSQPDLAKAMGQANRGRYLEKYSPEAHLAALERVFATLRLAQPTTKAA